MLFLTLVKFSVETQCLLESTVKSWPREAPYFAFVFLATLMGGQIGKSIETSLKQMAVTHLKRCLWMFPLVFFYLYFIK